MPIPILAPNLLGQAAQQRHDVFNTDRQNAENRRAAAEQFKQKMIGTFVDAGLQAAQNFGMQAYKEATEGARDAQRVELERNRTNESIAAARAGANVDQIGYKPPKPIPVDESPFKPDAVLPDVKPADIEPFTPKMSVSEVKPPGPKYELPPSAPVQGRPLERYGTTIEPKKPVTATPSDVLAAVPTRTNFAEMAEKRAATANKTQALESVDEQAKSMPVYAQEWQRATINKRESDALAAAALAAQERFKRAEALAKQNQTVIKDIIKASDENAPDLYRTGQAKHAPPITSARQPVLDEYGFMRMEPAPQTGRFGAIPSGGGGGRGARFKSPLLTGNNIEFYSRGRDKNKNALVGTLNPNADTIADYLSLVSTEPERFNYNTSTYNMLTGLANVVEKGGPEAEAAFPKLVELIKSVNAPLATAYAGQTEGKGVSTADMEKALAAQTEALTKRLEKEFGNSLKVEAAKGELAGIRDMAAVAAEEAVDQWLEDANEGSFSPKVTLSDAERGLIIDGMSRDKKERDAAFNALPDHLKPVALAAGRKAHGVYAKNRRKITESQALVDRASSVATPAQPPAEHPPYRTPDGSSLTPAGVARLEELKRLGDRATAIKEGLVK